MAEDAKEANADHNSSIVPSSLRKQHLTPPFLDFFHRSTQYFSPSHVIQTRGTATHLSQVLTSSHKQKTSHHDQQSFN